MRCETSRTPSPCMRSGTKDRWRMSTPENGGQARTPRLVRTRRGRMIGGVCSGLGDHFGVDPILLRIAFVGVTLFAGAGFWLYLAILLLVPEEGASRAPVR